MNKCGQLGKIISTLPVLFLIFIVLGVFIYLSVVAANAKPASLNLGASGTFDNNLLLERVEIDGKSVLVFDAGLLYVRGELSEQDFQEKLEGLLSEDNDCLFLKIGFPGPGGLVLKFVPNPDKYDDSDPDYIIKRFTTWASEAPKYVNAGILSEGYYFNVDGEDRMVASYYGRCLDE